MRTCEDFIQGLCIEYVWELHHMAAYNLRGWRQQGMPNFKEIARKSVKDGVEPGAFGVNLLMSFRVGSFDHQGLFPKVSISQSQVESRDLKGCGRCAPSMPCCGVKQDLSFLFFGESISGSFGIPECTYWASSWGDLKLTPWRTCLHIVWLRDSYFNSPRRNFDASGLVLGEHWSTRPTIVMI